MDEKEDLPDSASPALFLTQPSWDEWTNVAIDTAPEWKDSLTLSLYLEESRFLETIPLAKDGGLTQWVLTEKDRAENGRRILASCETIRKRALASDAQGNIEENIIHGIASVFCSPQYRGHGYATRLMRELARILRTYQSEYGRCIGTILYSDIGKAFYTRLGWHPNASNWHLVFQPVKGQWPGQARAVFQNDLGDLCRRDEQMIRAAMVIPAPGFKRHMSIVPDLDHMLWHLGKEDFATDYIFGKRPPAKGAIAGMPGRQVWALWTHRYYGDPRKGASKNVLYILRLVVEGDVTANQGPTCIFDTKTLPQYAEQAVSVLAVIRAAQAEAEEWNLNEVNLWEPSPLVAHLLSQSEVDFEEVERENEGIASGMWYAVDGGTAGAPVWINNEHYTWL